MSDTFIHECEFTIHGEPKTKSNHNLVNANGKKILPKNSAYALYEKQIVNSILDQVGDKKFQGKVICVLNVYFKHREKHPDLNNMTKSICDGIEKSCIIQNDRDIVSVYMDENYDYDNPRVEVGIYDYFLYKPQFKIVKRTKKEITELNKEMSVTKKKKSSSKKGKEIICSICGKATDLDHSKLIIDSKSKKKEYVCFTCILTGC